MRFGNAPILKTFCKQSKGPINNEADAIIIATDSQGSVVSTDLDPLVWYNDAQPTLALRPFHFPLVEIRIVQSVLALRTYVSI
jgi:hypothetical protein